MPFITFSLANLLKIKHYNLYLNSRLFMNLNPFKKV